MHKLDRALGPLNPNKRAAKTAKDPGQILVFNALEAQSASVCEILIKSNKFIVHALVDDESNPTAQKLKGLQCRLIVGDFKDPRTYLEHLKHIHSAFIHFDFEQLLEEGESHEVAMNREIQVTKSMIDACVEAGVEHMVYSTLDDLPKDYDVPHCATKAEVTKYIKSTKLPTTFLYTCTPYSRILDKHLVKPQPDGTILLDVALPDDCEFPGFAAEQTGDWVKMALRQPKKWAGHDMQACGQHLTVAKMAQALSKMSKKDVHTPHITKDQFYSDEFRKRLGEIDWSHFRAFLDGKVMRDVSHSETVVPQQWSFKQWAIQSKELQGLLKDEEK